MEIPILLAAFGPIRRSEICALDSDHINGNIVHVEYAMVQNEDKEWIIKVPKTFAGDRFIDFPDFVAEKLRGKKVRIVEFNPMAVTHRFARMLKKLNIQHFRFHDLRHPYVKHTAKNISLQKQKSQTTNSNLIVWVFCFRVLFLMPLALVGKC